MLFLESGIVLKQCVALVKCLHSERVVWWSCNASKPADPRAWLLSEQQADVGICQEYAALRKNTEEAKSTHSF